MNFRIKKDKFIEVLLVLEKALSSRVIIESLKGIKIDVLSDRLILSSSKSDLSLEYTLTLDEDLEINETGSVLINGAQFINIIKKVDEETITLLKENNTLQIKTLNSKINLNLYDISTYPNFNFPEDDNLFDLKCETLNEIYQKTKYSTSKNSANLILNGINIDFNTENIKATSTDTRRLSYVHLPKAENEYTNNITINSNLFNDLVKIFELTKCENVKISNSHRQLYMELPGLKIKARLLDGEFPNASQLIPEDFNFTLVVSSHKLLNSLEKIKYIAENGSVVTFEYVNSSLQVKFFDLDSGGIEDKIFVEELKGDPFKIAFDPEFVIDALNSLKSDLVQFKFVSEISAFLIVAKDKDDNLQIISPIRMG